MERGDPLPLTTVMTDPRDESMNVHRSSGDQVDLQPRSREVTRGYERAPARAMLRAVGMTDEDFDKPQIGVGSSWNELTPCNLSLERLARRAKEGVRAAGGFPLEFGTISVSDSIAMGHEGMRASLVSREVIADSVECVMHAERLDGSVLLAGCDKSEPGMLMAAARLNLASVYVYAGTTLPARLGASVRRLSARSSGPPVQVRVHAGGCSRPTPCRALPRRSAWRCRGAPHHQLRIGVATTTPSRPVRRWCGSSNAASPPARS